MAQFSASDINDAKRRVEQMHQRAKTFVDDNNAPPSSQKQEPEPHHQPEPEPHHQLTSDFEPSQQGGFSISSIFKALGIGGEKEHSSGLILALILILSHEKADNMLILALLYILL